MMEHRADFAALLLAALAGLVLFGTGWLLRPELPAGPWHVEWAGAREGMDRFDGTIIITAAGPNVFRPGPTATTATATNILRRGGLFIVGAIAGEPSGRPAPLVTLYGPDGQEAIMLALHGDDVLYRHRTRGSAFDLHSPAVRAENSLAGVAAGDTLRIMTMAHREGRCIQVHDRPHCGLGHTPGTGWQILAGDHHAGGVTGRALNAAWIALLLLPAGLMARPRIAAAIMVAAIWYLVIRLPVDTVLQPAPAAEAVAAAAALLAGALLRWRNMRARAGTTPPAVPAGG